MPKLQDKKMVIQEFGVSAFAAFLYFVSDESRRKSIVRKTSSQDEKHLIEQKIRSQVSLEISQWRNIWPHLMRSGIVNESFEIIDHNMKRAIDLKDIDAVYEIVRRKIYNFNINADFWRSKDIFTHDEVRAELEKTVIGVSVRTSGGPRSFNAFRWILESFDIAAYASSKGYFYSMIDRKNFALEEIKTADGDFISKYELFDFLDQSFSGKKIQSKTSVEVLSFLDEYTTSKLNVNSKSEKRTSSTTPPQKRDIMTFVSLGMRTSVVYGLVKGLDEAELTKDHSFHVNAIRNTFNFGVDFAEIIQSKFEGISYHAITSAFNSFFKNTKSLIKIEEKIKNEATTVDEDKVLTLDIESAYVSVRGKRIKTGLSSDAAQAAREKAKETGKSAEDVVREYVESIATEQIKISNQQFELKEVITTSEEDDDMGCDYMIAIGNFERYYEVKKIKSFSSISFKVSFKQLKMAIDNKTNYFFLFVDSKNSIREINGQEIISRLQFTPIDFSATLRKETELRNLDEVKSFIF